MALGLFSNLFSCYWQPILNYYTVVPTDLDLQTPAADNFAGVPAAWMQVLKLSNSNSH